MLGLSHAYWAMVAAAAVLAAPSMSKRILRGVHRMIGTILGVLVTAGLHKWKRDSGLSIFGGTAFYMLLVNVVL